MHYRKKQKPPKVTTEKFSIDTRILDLLNIESKMKKVSNIKIFEEALLTCLQSPNLPLKFKTKKRKKFLIEETTQEFFLNKCEELGVNQTTLAQKALAEFLTKKQTKIKRRQINENR